MSKMFVGIMKRIWDLRVDRPKTRLNSEKKAYSRNKPKTVFFGWFGSVEFDNDESLALEWPYDVIIT